MTFPVGPSLPPPFSPAWTRVVRVMAASALRDLAATLKVAIRVGDCVGSEDGGFATFRVSFLEMEGDGPSPEALENERTVTL